MPQTFTFDDLKTILVDRIGVPEDNIKDDPETTFEDMGLDSLALVDDPAGGPAGVRLRDPRRGRREDRRPWATRSTT